MKEKIDEMYKEYLTQKLNLILKKVKSIEVNNMPNFRIVRDKDKIYFIDKDGNRINSKYYDDVGKFRNGFAKVRKNNRYNFVDVNGNVVINEWYDDVDVFIDGYAIVTNNDKYNFVDTKGKLIFSQWYDEIKKFNEGYAIVKKNKKYYCIDRNGNLLTKNGYDNIGIFDSGTASVTKEFMGIGEYNIIDKGGKEVFDKWLLWEKFFNVRYTIINNNFMYAILGKKKILICTAKDLNNYSVKKSINGYRCIKNEEKYNVKYEPIRIYDSRYSLCIDKENIYLFDRFLEKYTMLGNIRDLDFIDNFIFDRNNEIVYFIYERKIFDITDYYNENIDDITSIVVRNGVDILSKDEFYAKNVTKVREELQKSYGDSLKIEEAKLKEIETNKNLEEKKQEILKNEAIHSILKGIKKLEEYEKKTGHIERIVVNSLFTKVDDHKEINSLYLKMGLLKYINLGMESFDNAKIDGIDFRGCNIHFNPQRIYHKDLSNCNFESIYIPPFMNFTNVDIRGTKFSQDNDPKTLDGYNVTFEDAIYDENTTYNGVSFVQLFGNCEKEFKHIK